MKHLHDPQVRADLVRRLRSVEPDRAPLWGRMSAHGMLCHLSDAFRMAMGERPSAPISGWLYRTVVKWVALHGPFPFPKGVPTMPEVDQEAGGTPPVAFERDRDELLRLVERFTHPVRDFTPPPHPIFGPLTDSEWGRWAYLHVDHHLRQFAA